MVRGLFSTYMKDALIAPSIEEPKTEGKIVTEFLFLIGDVIFDCIQRVWLRNWMLI